MRPRKIGGELRDQGRNARRQIATVVVVTYSESVSSVPRLPEIEDCVQDVVRRRFGLGQCSKWLGPSSAEQRMDLEGGYGLLSMLVWNDISPKEYEQQYLGLLGSYGVARWTRPFPHVCGDCKVTNK